MQTNIFDRFSFIALFLVVILLPVFCLPFTNIPVETSKGLLLVLGLTCSVVFWAIARFSDGKIVFPKSWLLVSGLGIAFVFLLSSLFSKSSEVSMFGTMFDIGSFYFVFTAVVFMIMSSIVFKSPKQAKIVLLGIILSSVFVLIFQSIHLFFPQALSLGILADKTSNVLGTWNGLGLFAGFACLMFLLVIEFFPISKIEKILLEVFILISILVGAAVNFPLVWVLLGISSLIIFVYKISITFNGNIEEGKERHFPVISFTVMMIALLFFVSGQFIGGFIPNRLQISNTEISPSFTATVETTKGVLMKNPLLGIGPNRFGEAWSMYKSQYINDTQFWDTSFNSGSGLLPTIFATTGALGILSFITFFVLLLFIGIKSVFSSIKNGTNWEIVAFFVLSLYLFVSSFFYSTGSVMFLLSFAFTGIFIGLSAFGSGQEKLISFLNDHRKSFFSILILIFMVILSVVFAFKYLERFVSVSYFGRAVLASTEPLAEDSINKALSLYQNDLYLRTYSQIYLVKLNAIANKGSELSDADKAELQTSFEQAISSAQMATKYNLSNYLNFQMLGSAYQAVGSLGVKDAYTNAVTAFKSASILNPLNPGLKLAIAGALFVDGKVSDAKDYANQALALKPDYIDALITLSEIAKKEGNMSGAETYAKQALSLSPTDKSLIQYVNSLNVPTPAPTVSEPTTNKTKK
ncbi:MAG: hypothetical protein WCP17_02490 [bacterium]